MRTGQKGRYPEVSNRRMWPSEGEHNGDGNRMWHSEGEHNDPDDNTGSNDVSQYNEWNDGNDGWPYHNRGYDNTGSKDGSQYNKWNDGLITQVCRRRTAQAPYVPLGNQQRPMKVP